MMKTNNKRLNIAIIGGGWLGCHVASVLRKQHDVVLFEKCDLFNGSSLYNQNRLHRGFHYSRNHTTRKLCSDTFSCFMRDYAHLVDHVDNNLYVIPHNKSLIDYSTFKGIFAYDGIPFTECEVPFLSNIEGSVLVDEKYINPIKTKQYFQTELEDCVVYKDVTPEDLHTISDEYDLVINTTNNQLQPLPNHFYELSLTLLYAPVQSCEFGAITMVDGPLFSIYPYEDGQYTLTDVQYTPLFVSNDYSKLLDFKLALTQNYLDDVRSKMEEKVVYYYKDFKRRFQYCGYYTSVKVKRLSESADRSPTIVQQDNIITCVTGKIQGVYSLEKYIRDEIANR